MFHPSDFLKLRTEYSRHVLRAHFGGFHPLTLAQFATFELFAIPLF